MGHPLVDKHHAYLPQNFTQVKESNVTLGLLPGSRRNEIKSLLPRMVETANLLFESGSIHKAVIAKVPHIETSFYQNLTGISAERFELTEIPMEVLLPELDAALVTSGTATLETAYYTVPMVIVYHVNPLTYWLGRMLIKLTHIGLANIVAEEEIAPELIQHEFTAQKAAHLLQKMLNPQVNEQLRQKMLIIRQKLGTPGASQRAAEQIHRFLINEKK